MKKKKYTNEEVQKIIMGIHHNLFRKVTQNFIWSDIVDAEFTKAMHYITEDKPEEIYSLYEPK